MNYCVRKGDYPDWCRIYTARTEGVETQFAGVDPDNPDWDSEEENDEQMPCPNKRILYQGECIKYGSSQMRKFANGSVIKADHCVDIPHVVPGILSGMRIDVVDAQGKWKDIEIVVAYADTTFGLGTTVFFNIVFN